MTTNPQTVMSIAVSHNRICFVYLIDKQPMDWEMSHKATSSPKLTGKKVSSWIEYYAPDVVITEDMGANNRKGARTKQLHEAMVDCVHLSDARHVAIARYQPFQSKYEQIEDLCVHFPQMRTLAPRKRRYWENEPQNVSYFEALSMAVLFREPPFDLPV